MTCSGSGATSGSGYSGGYYGSGSSNRLSSSSTLPSDLPHTPGSTEDTAGHRRFDKAFGSHKDKTSTLSSFGKRSVGGQYATSPPSRMALSTAEPPRIETHLDSISFEDMFSSFEPSSTAGIGSLSPTTPKLATSSFLSTVSNVEGSENLTGMRNPNMYNEPATGLPPPPKSYNPASITPKVQGIVKEKVQTWNTYSKPKTQNMYSNVEANGGTERWTGRPSEEGLISLPVEEKPNISPRHSRNLTHSTPAAPTHTRKDSLTAPVRNARPLRTNTGDQGGLKRSSAILRRHSIPTDDEDAAVVMNNVKRPQLNHSATATAVLGNPRGLSDGVRGRDSGWEETVGSASSSERSSKDNMSSVSSKDTAHTNISSPRSPIARATTTENFTTVKMLSPVGATAKSTSYRRPVLNTNKDGSDTEFDSSLSAAVTLAARLDDDAVSNKPNPAPQKVMTRAQFERYRQQQDEERRLRGEDKEDSDSESDVDYDSDTERNKEIVRQRARQEAHLSVYRQQMMKITGTGAAASAEALNPMPMAAAPMLSLNNSYNNEDLIDFDGFGF